MNRGRAQSCLVVQQYYAPLLPGRRPISPSSVPNKIGAKYYLTVKIYMLQVNTLYNEL